MRAIRRLERRFNAALSGIETSTSDTDTSAETAKLSNEITELEAWKTEQEQVLEKATADITAAQKDLASATDAKATLETQVAELTANLNASAQSGEVAQNQLSELAAQKLAAEVALQQAQDSLSELSKSDGDVAAVNAKLAQFEKENANLQAELEAARTAAPSENDNTEIANELAALKAQRETDLAEVNVILEKLIPLVEAK